ncbi:hypothetical protein Dimus_013981, partial [Dionaea muscipula]
NFTAASPKPPPTQDSTPARATTKTRTSPPGNPNSSFIFLIHHLPRGHSSSSLSILTVNTSKRRITQADEDQPTR